MIELLLNCDKQLLLFINGIHMPWLDEFMWALSSKWINFPLACILFLMLYKTLNWKKAIFLLFTSLLVVGLSDLITSQLIKDLIQRPRPSHDIILQSKLHFYYISNQPYLGGQYGFVSSHAANLAAVFMYLFIYLRNNKCLLFGFMTYVLFVGISRIYLGVHYPSDILGGFIFGLAMGWALRKFVFGKLLLKWE